jgi:hypothetical protein
MMFFRWARRLERSDGKADVGHPQEIAAFAQNGIATAAVARAACTAHCSHLQANSIALMCVAASDRAE